MQQPTANFSRLAAASRQSVIDLRRHFHMYPEAAWQEQKTSKIIQSALSRLGVSFKSIAETGILATIEGDHSGKTVALRADMDALQLPENNNHEYVSRHPGVCHACGHDAHMAMLLGAAGILNDMKKHIRGTVKLIFQPAEETFGGARAIIEAGGLDDVDGIFGLHILGRLPVGQAAVASGTIMAAANYFTIHVRGQSGHGGLPHEGVDAVPAAAAIVMNLQSVSSREISPLESVVVSIGSLQAGTAYNVIAGSATLEGTTRCFSEDVNDKLPGILERIAKNTAEAYGARATIDYRYGVPPTVNDSFCTRLAEKTIETICGGAGLHRLPPMTGAEDYAFYLQKTPGVFVFLGGGNKTKGLSFPQHHESFDIDEQALEIDTALNVQYALDFLNTAAPS